MKKTVAALMLIMPISIGYATPSIDNIALAKRTLQVSNEILDTRLQENNTRCRLSLLNAAVSTENASGYIHRATYLLASLHLGHAKSLLYQSNDCSQQSKMQSLHKELTYIGNQIAGLD